MGVPSGVFGAVTGILVIVIIIAGLAIVYHHRQIVDIGMFPLYGYNKTFHIKNAFFRRP